MVQDYKHLQHSKIQNQMLDSQDHRVVSGLPAVAVVDQSLISLEEHIKELGVPHLLEILMQGQE